MSSRSFRSEKTSLRNAAYHGRSSVGLCSPRPCMLRESGCGCGRRQDREIGDGSCSKSSKEVKLRCLFTCIGRRQSYTFVRLPQSAFAASTLFFPSCRRSRSSSDSLVHAISNKSSYLGPLSGEHFLLILNDR